MPAGRPTDYKPEFCEQLVEHMAQGLSFESFGAIADVHLGTLYTWTREHPEFHEAKKRGALKSRLLWEKIGMHGAVDAKKIVPPIWIFNMKNRFGWADAPAIPEDDQPEVYRDFED